jgi:hypothetical protein
VSQSQGEPPRAGLRASDADRDQAADRLRRHAAEGHITLDELSELLSRTYAARTYGELDTVVGNLPVPSGSPAGRVPDERRLRPEDRNLWWRAGVGPYVVINTMLIVIWAITGAGYFWPIWPILGWGAGLALAAVGGHGKPNRPAGPGQERR